MKSSILIALISFLLGIFMGDVLDLHWVITFTVWATLIIAFIFLLNYGRQIYALKKWINIALILILFFSGMLGYQMQTPKAYEKNFSHIFLEQDFIIGEIVDFQKGKNNYDKAIVSVRQVVKPHTKIHAQGELLCYVKGGDQHIHEGAVVMFQPNLSPIQNKKNPGEFDAEKYWKNKNISYLTFLDVDNVKVLGEVNTFSKFWTKSRQYLIDVIDGNISPENRGLVVALSLGDKSKLSIEKRNQFANAGAMHVLAVSGMHVGILLGFLQFIFYQVKVLRKRNLYLFFALIAIWCFAFLTGMSASVTRAVTMFSILAIGQLLGKQFFNLQAIFASALFILIFNPSFLFDLGFQLSYLAVLGIAFFYRPIISLFHSSFKIVNYFWQGTVIGIAAQIGTLPLTLYYFNQFPNYFFLTNIGLLVMASIALISVVVFLIFHAIPAVSDGLAYGVNRVFDGLTLFIEWINSLPGEVSKGFTPHVIQVLLLYFFLILILYSWTQKKVKMFFFSIAVVFLLGLSLVVHREHNLSKKELVVLNNYTKTVLLKSNRQLFLIYDSSRNPSSKSLDFMVQGYESIVGLKAERIGIDKNESLKISNDIIVSSDREGWELNYEQHKLLLVDQMNQNMLERDYEIVIGAWNPYLDEENAVYNARKSAIFLSPE